MDYKYSLIRSNRKSIELSIAKNLEIIVRAPNKMKIDDINSFVQKNKAWIEKHLIVVKAKADKKVNHELSADEINELYKKANDIIPQKVEYYSSIMKVVPTGIKITSAKARWGSCNSKNSICFSYRLMLLPDLLIDYVVVHELAHIRVKNHSKLFYQEIERYMPDYRNRVSLIKTY